MQFPFSPAYRVIELAPHLSHDAALETQWGYSFSSDESGDGPWLPLGPFGVAPFAPRLTPKTAPRSSGHAPADPALAAQLARASPSPHVADTVVPIPGTPPAADPPPMPHATTNSAARAPAIARSLRPPRATDSLPMPRAMPRAASQRAVPALSIARRSPRRVPSAPRPCPAPPRQGPHLPFPLLGSSARHVTMTPVALLNPSAALSPGPGVSV